MKGSAYRLVQGILLAGAVACAACGGSMKSYTAGMIGCPPDDVEILNDSGYGFGARSWQARCYGKTYQCSGAMNSASCAPLQTPPADGAAPAK